MGLVWWTSLGASPGEDEQSMHMVIPHFYILKFPHLEVVWQLGAAGVAWVHGDEHAEGGAQRQLGALKLKGLDACCLGALHSQDLLRDHTQHLQ